MRVAVAIGLGVFISVAAAGQDRGTGLSFCKPAGKPRFLANVPEASGVALSGRDGAILWTLNDSGEPQLFGFDASGTSTRVTVTGAELLDWEDTPIRSASISLVSRSHKAKALLSVAAISSTS